MYHIDCIASVVMKSLRTNSTYTLWVIGLYIILFPFILEFVPDALRYDFSSTYLGHIILIVTVTILCFYALNLVFKFYKIRWQELGLVRITRVALYSILFAVPEEIIFRGIIQSALQNSVGSIFIAVVISSVIYGLAHLPNGARGLRPMDWNWEFTATTFFVGLPLGFIFAITGSLLIPTFLHAILIILFNLLVDERPNIQKL